MQNQDLRELLEQLRSGHVEVDAVLARLQTASMADLGYAHVDQHRRERCGFPEVIFCEGKTSEWIEGVVRKLTEAKQDCLATRVSAEQAEHLARVFPQAQQDRLGRTFWLPAGPLQPPVGKVVVITAGTSDLPVAQEAATTARALGTDVSLLADVGVAGIHRLLRHQAQFSSADAIVVVAGMDGALPSVVGGLAALLTMLNCCSAGVVVVNIDSGFKGGYVAATIARQTAKKQQ